MAVGLAFDGKTGVRREILRRLGGGGSLAFRSCACAVALAFGGKASGWR